MKKNSIITLILSVVSCVAFIISFQYSNSSKALLLKSNVEAISESVNPNDPGSLVILYYCYTRLKSDPGEGFTCLCADGTTTWGWLSSKTNKTNFTLYRCNQISGHTNALMSDWGFCFRNPYEH